MKRTSVQVRAPVADVDAVPDEEDNLDDEALPLVGYAFPVSVAMLGLAFVACALLVAGLPPLAGFVGKVALLAAATGLEAGDAGPGIGPAQWTLVGLLLASSLFATISLARAGIRHFWSKGVHFAPRLSAAEGGAVLMLLVAAAGLTVFAEPAMRYATATATAMHAPRTHYIDVVLSARPRPGPASPAAGPDVPAPDDGSAPP